jgi:hypothetical protein
VNVNVNVNARETWLLRILLLYSFLVMISFDVVLLVVVRVMKAVQDPSKLCFVGLFDQEGPNSFLIIQLSIFKRDREKIERKGKREKSKEKREERERERTKREREKREERDHS